MIEALIGLGVVVVGVWGILTVGVMMQRQEKYEMACRHFLARPNPGTWDLVEDARAEVWRSWRWPFDMYRAWRHYHRMMTAVKNKVDRDQEEQQWRENQW